MKKKATILTALLVAIIFSVNSFSTDSSTFSVTNRRTTSTQNQQPTNNRNNMQQVQPVSQQTPVNVTPTERRVELEPITQTPVGENLQLSDITTDMDLDVDDPGITSQYYLEVTNSYLVWDYIEDKQDETVYVAVLDTGVDYDHEDLENRVDEDMGYDFVNNDDDPMDDNGHGTHVSGIIAAEMDNGVGIVGVTGDLDVVIVPIKVLDEDGTGDVDDVIDGIEYAIEQEVDIINISFGSSDDDDSDDLEDAIQEAIDEGIFVVVAAGNDSTDCDEYIPTGFDDVYTVAATSTNNLPASFTNYGDSVEIMASGEKILSSTLNDSYEAWDGTSMSAPIVSGIAAMMLAYDENLTVDELSDLLNDAGNYLDAYEGFTNPDEIGYGLIDAGAAYEDLSGDDIYDQDDFLEELEPEEPANNQGLGQYSMPGRY